MDDKNIKDLIDISKGLDDAVLKGIERGRKDKKAEKKNKNRFMKRALIAAGLAGVITTGVGIINPEIVSAIPGVNKVFENFNKEIFGGSTEKYADIATVVGTTVIDKDISVTFEEFIFDENNIMATLTLRGEKIKSFKEGISYVTGVFNVDGKEIQGESRIQMLDDNSAAVVIKNNIANENLNDNANIEFEITEIIGDGPKEIEGDWNFKVKGEKKKGRRVKTDVEVKIPKGFLKAKEVVMTNISTTIILEGHTNDPNDSSIQSIDFLVKDDKGNYYSVADCENGLFPEKGEHNRVITIKGDLTNSSYIEIEEKVGGDRVDVKSDESMHALLQFNGDGEFERKEIIRKATKEELADGYAFDEVKHYVNISKDFKTLDEIIGDKIEVSKGYFIEIINIEKTELGTKFTFKTDGKYDYNNLSQLQIFDEEFNDMIKGEGYRKYGAIESEEDHKYSITIDNLDWNKKYTVGIPKVEELEKPNFTMKIDLK